MAKAPQMTFDTDIALPKSKGAFGRSNPTRALIRQATEQLPLDASYHIPATDEVPEPHKFYGHQIVAANSEFVRKAVAGEKGEIKHFTLKPVDETDKRGKGARLFRVANLTKDQAHARAEASAAALATRQANKAKKEAAPKEEQKAAE